MLESINGKYFEYKKLTPDEQKKRGILGRLVGTMADAKHPTRNGRLYDEELWNKTFDNPIMKEKIANKCCFGELGHPTDRTEVDMEKIAICLDDFPKKDRDGKLIGVFNILDTPNGRILKTLCDYGCNIGISSRGNGEVNESFDGTQVVDPDTYECECWDAVLIPAVKEARLTYVTESLDGKKSLTEALAESVKASNKADRKIMVETLGELGFKYTEEEGINESVEAGNAGATVVEDLKEALKARKAAEQLVMELQEKLSACNARESALNEELARYKSSIVNLGNMARNAKALSNKVDTLNEQLLAQDKLIKEQSAKITARDTEINNLNSRSTSETRRVKELNEELAKRESSIKWLKSLNEKLVAQCGEKEKECRLRESRLQESVENLKKDSSILKQEFTKKLNEAQTQVSKYKKLTSIATNRYIESKALSIGVDVNEVKNKLNESYTFNDIDRVCESLQNYQLNISKLPFSVGSNKNVKVKVSESFEPIKPNSGYDDNVDSSLLELAKLN